MSTALLQLLAAASLRATVVALLVGATLALARRTDLREAAAAIRRGETPKL
jgi:hypothetical protein